MFKIEIMTDHHLIIILIVAVVLLTLAVFYLLWAALFTLNQFIFVLKEIYELKKNKQ